MKNVVLTVMAMMMAVVMLTACGSDKTGDLGKKVYKVGVTQYADQPSLDNCREGFIKGLEDNGFVEGDNLEIEYQAAQANDSMNTQIAQTFANGGMDLVCGIATPSAQALYVACKEKKIHIGLNRQTDKLVFEK